MALLISKMLGMVAVSDTALHKLLCSSSSGKMTIAAAAYLSLWTAAYSVLYLQLLLRILAGYTACPLQDYCLSPATSSACASQTLLRTVCRFTCISFACYCLSINSGSSILFTCLSDVPMQVYLQSMISED